MKIEKLTKEQVEQSKTTSEKLQDALLSLQKGEGLRITPNGISLASLRYAITTAAKKVNVEITTKSINNLLIITRV